jgi:hypothetical protein
MTEEILLEAKEIGHGVSVTWMQDGTGIYWSHPGCKPWFWLKFMPHPESTGHTLVTKGGDFLEHLTIQGSLLCPRGCGFHGWVTDGKWVTG